MRLKIWNIKSKTPWNIRNKPYFQQLLGHLSNWSQVFVLDNLVTKVIFSNAIKVDFILIMISFKKALHPNSYFKMKVLCSVCGLSLEEVSLRKHLKIHESRSLHPCDICDKKFTQKKYLSAHMKTHAISCKFCNKIFEKRNDLSSHMKEHKVT